MSNSHWLKITEYLFLAGSGLGTVIAAATQQAVYAAAPITITLGLNLANRGRFDQKTHPQTETAIALLQQQVTNLDSLQSQIAELRDAIALLQQQVTNSDSLKSQIAELQGAIAQFPTPEPNSPTIEPDVEIQPLLPDTITRWQCVNTLTGNLAPITTLTLHPNGQIIATNTINNTIQLWDIQTEQKHLILKGHSQPVLSIAFNPHAQTLASGSADLMIKLWDTRTGQQKRSLKGYFYYFLAVAFSPDGLTLASGSADCTVKLWDANTLAQKRIFKGHGELIDTLSDHAGAVTSVVFSPDGQRLISGSSDKTIKIWRRL
ncbi:hypothetical protein [Coleofasciculus sp. F4-SAH-05]|uniref:hypothetical protein n=1 Tax=Coleofasciculus sp. F4-SAH-05 TaxID=3069525 RepID=UPI003300458F